MHLLDSLSHRTKILLMKIEAVLLPKTMMTDTEINIKIHIYCKINTFIAPLESKTV